jgi:hypothetical protein
MFVNITDSRLLKQPWGSVDRLSNTWDTWQHPGRKPVRRKCPRCGQQHSARDAAVQRLGFAWLQSFSKVAMRDEAECYA